MHVLTWILTGLLAGWLARLAQGGRGTNVLTDLTLGLLGALVGGWMLRLLGLTEAGAGVAHVIVASLGALVLLAAGRLAFYLTAVASQLAGAPRAKGTIEGLEARIARLGGAGREVDALAGARLPAVRDPNQAFDEQLTLGQRMSDHLAAFGGSWAFLGLFFAVMLGWMIYNTERPHGFDPYPFILLNLVLSCLAALQAPIIMMSQNRLSAKDRSDAKNDYEVNVRAELQIRGLHEKLDSMREEELVRLTRVVELQQRALDALNARLAESGR